MKVFLLFHGEYEQRGIHSVHNSKADAIAVDARVRRDWGAYSAGDADIEEHELDPALCEICGYEESLHIEHPDTWKHDFKRAAPTGPGDLNG